MSVAAGLATMAAFLFSALNLVVGASRPSSSDPELCPKNPQSCIECQSKYHPWCADPFDPSLVKGGIALRSKCDGFCVKMVTKDHENAPERVLRTCSDKMNIKLDIFLVCIHNSKPGTGKLCFCNRDDCNMASRLKPPGMSASLFVTLASVLLVLRPGLILS